MRNMDFCFIEDADVSGVVIYSCGTGISINANMANNIVGEL